jgi:hypothetical protein
VEIGIERHTDSSLLSRTLENPQVFRAAQPDLSDMSDVPAGGRKQLGRGTGKVYESSTWVTPEFKDMGYSFRVR